MKAAFLVGPRQIELHEVPAPKAPDDGLVLAVEACGICGSDLRRWKEGPPLGVEPIIPGHEAAGVVVEVGRSVTRYAVGQRLAIAPDIHCGECYFCRREMYNLCDNLRLVGITPGYPGALAERMVLTREVLENGIVCRLPEGMPFRDAALAEPACSVLAAQDKLGDGRDTSLVVMGSGPIGCLHVVVAKSRGARVFVAEPNEKRRTLAAQFGADALIDPAREDVVARVRELTKGLGADAVICANPVAATQTQAVQMVRKAGRVVLFGGLPKANPMVTLDANRIHYGEIAVVGAFSYHPSYLRRALDFIHRKVIRADRIITHVFSRDRTEEAFETAAGGEGLKIIVQMQPRGES